MARMTHSPSPSSLTDPAPGRWPPPALLCPLPYFYPARLGSGEPAEGSSPGIWLVPGPQREFVSFGWKCSWTGNYPSQLLGRFDFDFNFYVSQYCQKETKASFIDWDPKKQTYSWAKQILIHGHKVGIIYNGKKITVLTPGRWTNTSGIKINSILTK